MISCLHKYVQHAFFVNKQTSDTIIYIPGGRLVFAETEDEGVVLGAM